jgi:inner membrane protein
MDNLCHTLVGAACGEAGLKRLTRFGNPALMLAANLPDIDAVVFVSDIPFVAVRRGWTHGVLALAVLPVLFMAVMLAIDRVRPMQGDGQSRVRAGPMLVLAYVGVLSHVLLDFLNTYGIRLLMPFSERWFYGDAVFIIDPTMWLTLGAGVWLSRRLARTMPARVALYLVAAYALLMVASAVAAQDVVARAWLAERGSAARSLMVGPAPFTPLRKVIIVDAGDHYRVGSFVWLPRQVTFAAEAVLKNESHPAVAMARQDPVVRGILRWARFPYYELEEVPGGTRVTLKDLRFGDRVGSTSVVVPAEPF